MFAAEPASPGEEDHDTDDREDDFDDADPNLDQALEEGDSMSFPQFLHFLASHFPLFPSLLDFLTKNADMKRSTTLIFLCLFRCSNFTNNE